MKTKTINVYDINELSEKAREYAYNRWLSHGDYPWAEDNIATLKAFEKLFPIRIAHWSYGGRGEGVSFYMTDDTLSEMAFLRLAKYIHNNYGDKLFKPKFIYAKGIGLGVNTKTKYSAIEKDNCCVLTGYCIDDDILRPIYEFLDTPDHRTFNELIKDCFESWVIACEQDMGHYYSMDNFVEESQANELEYNEQGRLL